MEKSYKENFSQIKAFVFDVDGVFTDGKVYLMPDGSMSRVMNVQDGYGVVTALKKGFKIGIITGGNDPMVKARLEYLGLEDYYPAVKDKLIPFQDFKEKYNLKDEEILMMGDDLPDLPLIKKSLIGACPANAVAEIKLASDYISPIKGGEGAVRDVIEQVLKSQNLWQKDAEIQSR